MGGAQDSDRIVALNYNGQSLKKMAALAVAFVSGDCISVLCVMRLPSSHTKSLSFLLVAPSFLPRLEQTSIIITIVTSFAFSDVVSGVDVNVVCRQRVTDLVYVVDSGAFQQLIFCPCHYTRTQNIAYT